MKCTIYKNLEVKYKHHCHSERENSFICTFTWKETNPKKMPKNCIKFISGFLIPNLDNENFGNRLKWIDKSQHIFQIEWRHKGGPKWTEQEAEVFVQWDKHKGHFQPSEKSYFTQSKQRFRSLLYKLKNEGQLKEMKSPDKYIKVFSIGEKKQKRKRKSSDLSEDYELPNEGEISSEERNEQSDYTYEEEIEDANNVLEDHSYSSSNSQNSFTDGENNEVLSSFDDCIPISLSELPLPDTFEKRVLMERNLVHEGNMLFPVSNINEISLLFLQSEETENMNNTRLTEKLKQDAYLTSVQQNKFITMSDSNTSLNLQNHDLLDLSQVKWSDI